MLAYRGVHRMRRDVTGVGASFRLDFLKNHFDGLRQTPCIVIRRRDAVSIRKFARFHRSSILRLCFGEIPSQSVAPTTRFN